MVDALTFYKDLNSLVTDQEFEDSDLMCANLNAFLDDWGARMQTEVLQTGKLESRLDYLEIELNRIKDMREQFDHRDSHLMYHKQLPIDIDGEVVHIGASIANDKAKFGSPAK